VRAKAGPAGFASREFERSAETRLLIQHVAAKGERIFARLFRKFVDEGLDCEDVVVGALRHPEIASICPADRGGTDGILGGVGPQQQRLRNRVFIDELAKRRAKIRSPFAATC